MPGNQGLQQGQLQISAQDVINVVCALIDTPECRQLIMAGSGQLVSYDEMVEFCEELNDFNPSNERQNCRYYIQTQHMISRAGVDMCKNASFVFGGGALACVKQIEGYYIDMGAAEVCKNDMMNLNKCALAIRGKYYSARELSACENDFMHKIGCLNTYGVSVPGYSDYMNRGNNGGGTVIILDNDGITNDDSSSSGMYCSEVRNSSQNVLKRNISLEDFARHAMNVAITNGKCVVTNVYNEDNSRYLIDANGNLVNRDGMSNNQMIEYRQRHRGFDRCAQLTCVP